MNKKVIYVDMDGVISDFDKAAKLGGYTHRPDLKSFMQMIFTILCLC